MTTVLNPTGTPTPIYNRSGTTVAEMTVDMSSPGIHDISALSTKTIVVATITNPDLQLDRGFRLPASRDVGDVVEIYVSELSQYFIHAPSGEGVRQANGSYGAFRSVGGPATFTKVTSTMWVPFFGAP